MAQPEIWTQRFLDLAEMVASWSKDPSTKVGAVVVRPDKTIASVGYNGFPRGVSDDPRAYANRETKYLQVVHAELNALLVAREPLHGYTIFLTLPPCSSCTGAIIQAGITTVVAIAPTPEQRERWGTSLDVGRGMMFEAHVDYTEVQR